MNTSYSTKVFLNVSKPNKDGLYPIYIRIICNRKKTELSTNILIEEGYWDKARLIIKKNPELNQQIASILNDINNWMKSFIESGKQPDLSEIRKLVKGKSNVKLNLNEYIQQYCFSIENSTFIKKSSKVQYKATAHYLLDFLKQTRYGQMPLDEVNQKLIMDFDLFLKSVLLPTGRNFELNTIHKHHSRFRSILIKAQKESLLEKNPYVHFKLKKVKSQRTFLSQNELDEIFNLDLRHNLSLDRVKDIFIFSVYTGLRFEDAQSLTKSNIIKNPKGKFEIKLNQRKTGESAIIPLLKPAEEIIEKYKEVMSIDGKGRILPKISNQKTNAYLKVIADLAGINKLLTHHVARHTCATTVLLANDVSIEAVSGWLGHTSIKTTQIYAKITEDLLQRMADKVSEKLNVVLAKK